MGFLLERLLKFIMEIRKKRHNENEDNVVEKGLPISSISGSRHAQCTKDISHLIDIPSFGNESSAGAEVHTREMAVSLNNIPMPEKIAEESSETRSNGNAGSPSVDQCGHEHGHSHGDGDIAAMAWMIILGDGMHSFINWVSIGASFTDRLMSGISVSVAVACEELPHELGDFAILDISGMSTKKAMGYSFLSACMCYFGLIAGILLGKSPDSTDWIFAIAGGMFLYLAPVDITPEMNISAEEVEKQKANVCDIQVFVLQHFGILLDSGIITVMLLFDHNIDFTDGSVLDDTVNAVLYVCQVMTYFRVPLFVNRLPRDISVSRYQGIYR